MACTSVWRATVRPAAFRALKGEVTADVAIVGGGITGITLALLLAAEGRSVVLIEARRVGQGATGNSTGNLYAVLSDGLHGVRAKWDDEVMRTVARSRAETVDFVEQTVARLAIECAFRRCPLWLYAADDASREKVRLEHEAAVACGLAARLVTPGPTPLARGQALMIERQAQFHPLAYVLALAQRAAGAGCRIHEQTPALEIDERHGAVRTPDGRVRAPEIVLATHTPKGRYGVHAEMEVHREYGVAGPLRSGTYPDGIVWGVGGFGHSLRSVEADGERRLVCIGEEEPTGRHDAAQALARLEAFARASFDMGDAEFRWSAQNYRSPDGLPYIGRTLGSRAWVATGFATDGLTWGTLAARILADGLLGRANPWADAYKAQRFAPLKAAKSVLQESLQVAKALLRDYVTDREKAQLDALAPGSGAVLDIDGEKLAAYRDERGALSVVSSVCTHMGCQVHWNAAERSWDCPCHGSRFDTAGAVLEGPAIAPLARKRPAP